MPEIETDLNPVFADVELARESFGRREAEQSTWLPSGRDSSRTFYTVAAPSGCGRL
jgi:hypothetical protein